MKQFLLALLFVCSIFGQTERGNIAGVVTDATGAVVPGASVVVTHRATNTVSKVTSTAAGEYNVAALSPGEYRVEVVKDGFRRFVVDSAILTAASTLRVDAALQVGAVSETVEVVASSVQVQAENAKATTAVSNTLVDSLPLVVGDAMRSPLGLVEIAPESRGSGGSMRLGGGQGGAWNATMDGISVGTNRVANTAEVSYNTPSVEAITEFAVDTNGFKAEYGQAGGGVMTFVSKSGTNAFHGNLYDFFRNEKLDSRGFFGKVRGVYKQNDFGGSAGAPVWIPKIYDGRNRTFFFVTYEGFRNRVGSSGNISSVPTPEMFDGDFSKWVDKNNKLLPVFNPFTTREASPGSSVKMRDVFSENKIPASMFANFSKLMIPYGKKVSPNRGGTPGTYDYVSNNFITTTGTNIHPTDKFSIKADHNLSTNHRLAFYYNHTYDYQGPGPGGPPGLPLPLYSGQYSTFTADTYRINHTWTVTPRLLNTFSFGYNSFYKDAASPNAVGGWKDKFCLKIAIDCDVNFPTVQFNEGFANWGSSANNGTGQPLRAIKNDTSYFRGKHNFKFGYAWDDQRSNGFGQQDISGRVVFNRNGTGVPGSTSSSPTNGGSAFASFLLGWVDNSETETVRNISQRYSYHGFYIQDDIRLTRKFTLNVGVRYDVTLPPVSGGDVYSDFTPDRPNPLAGGRLGALRFAGFGPGRENSRSLVPGWYKGIGPRIGMAYSPDEKTSFRAAFGRSFGRVTVIGSSGHYDGSAQNYVLNTADKGITPAFLVDNGPPTPYILPPFTNPSYSNNNAVSYWQPRDAARASESLYWTFSIQRQLGKSTVVEGSYNATVGTHLQANLINLNQVSTSIFKDMVARYGEAGAVSLMNSKIYSPAATAAGIPAPYANFLDTAYTPDSVQSVSQALRPYPQYGTINVGNQGGDRSGHSSYHAMVLKADRRLSGGLNFNFSYVLSKMITDAETAGSGSSSDQYNRRLEKALAGSDQTHVFKFSTVYELPFFRGKAFVGGWRISAIQAYNSGTPLGVSRNNPLPLFNSSTRPFITTYENWRAPIAGEKFNPAVDRFLNRAAFPATQPSLLWGNATATNPKVRNLWGRNENVSLAKSFSLTEALRAEFRIEGFNIFNRHTFSAGTTNLDSNNFGIVTSANGVRYVQLALKLYW